MAKGKIRKVWQFLLGDSARAFGTLSVVLVLLLATIPVKHHFREWAQYQSRYLRLIRQRGDAATLQRRFQSGLQQTWLPELNVVDRCTTCHVAMKENSLADVRMQPFRPHPPIPHSLTEFGCVMCHRGQGAATNVEEAHSSTKAWEQPILPARYIESPCGQCHENTLTGTPQLNAGKKLLTRYGCVGCHALRTPAGVQVAPTDEPPHLTHIAEKTSREWIYAWLKDPQAYSVSATMPDFKLSDRDARDIATFLISQSTPSGTAVVKPKAVAGEAQEGASVYGEAFCASCHAVQNAAGLMVGGDIGPELTRVGSKVKPDWLDGWLRNPKGYAAHTLMPRYRFSDKQLGLLEGFLMGKTDSDLLANVQLEPATKEQAARGKALVNERGCASCHEINSVNRPANFAPDLTVVGSRPLAKLVFVPGIAHTLPDYLAAKIRHPRAFGNQLKMPQYSFSSVQVDQLVTVLLAQTERAQTLPAELRQSGQAVSHYQPAGKAGKLIDDMQCFSCHRINGRGGDMAPDLTWEGSAVDRQWLVSFLKNPNTLRPALIRRMPKFNLTDVETTTLADYILTVYQTPAFDADSMDARSFTAQDQERGRQLFYSRYACQACHIVDPQNDKGYIGPTLTQVGTRLTPAWIFHYLKNPQVMRPGTIEPNQHLSDDDARSLTAFLVSQKGAKK
jgi:mono/diheme cytochrome c family protein